MYVSLYRVTRHYGGPEEGGWYYDRHQFVAVVQEAASKLEAREVAAALNAKAKEEKRQPSGNYQGRYSVANHTDEVYITEESVRMHDDSDEPRPHYE